MKLCKIVFSPTGGTKKVADRVASGLEGDTSTVDLSDPELDFEAAQLAQGDVAVIAVPSFGGRVPAVAAERLSKVRGNGARAVLVCVYGNRAYEDTLVELEDLARQAGFEVVAAIAAVAEHSIARQFATGRPDAQDVAQLAGFAEQIQRKLSAADCSTPAISGNRPYKNAGGAAMVPKATQACVACGVCVAGCPVQAISAHDPKSVDKKACISCMRCVAVCAQGARTVSSVMLGAASLMLKKACSERKACELFI